MDSPGERIVNVRPDELSEASRHCVLDSSLSEDDGHIEFPLLKCLEHGPSAARMGYPFVLPCTQRCQRGVHRCVVVFRHSSESYHGHSRTCVHFGRERRDNHGNCIHLLLATTKTTMVTTTR